MKRFRQFRADQATRDRYADVTLSSADFIYPYFAVEGTNVKEEIPSMPGVYHLSVDNILEDIARTRRIGINKVLLFGVIPNAKKDATGSEGYNEHGIICETIRAIKQQFPDEVVIADVCLCEYTSHGHCGIIHDHDVDNDATLPLLAEEAYVYAKAGADWVAPSAMMDGQIEAIRKRLDDEGLHGRCRILGYSAKYASAFYGPFRDAADSAPAFGDRRTYQMDYRTRNQGLDEIAADIEEGCDMTMVKPGMPYLDIIARATEKFPDVPMVTYQVSGEYSMLKAASQNGWLDEPRVVFESLIAMKRAGARYIITYYAAELMEKWADRFGVTLAKID